MVPCPTFSIKSPTDIINNHNQGRVNACAYASLNYIQAYILAEFDIFL